MIDKTVFFREFTILEEHYGKKLSEPLLTRYYQILTTALSTEEFLQACLIVFTHDKFFPTPGRFIEVVRGNVEDQAQLEWAKLTQAVSQNTRADLSDVGRAALTAVGGSWALQTTSTDRIMPAYIKAYVAAARQVEAKTLELVGL